LREDYPDGTGATLRWHKLRHGSLPGDRHERLATVGKLLDESLVTGLPPFLGLARDQVRQILDEAVSQRHDAGASVFSEGSPATQFFLLLDGHVRAQRTTRNGDQVILHQIPPGELFGIARAMGLETYPATAVVVAESIVIACSFVLCVIFIERLV
jgi:signal-transduction protein with cAMP-binding, CBS, and nucleotidyltransferase domain